MPPILRVFKRLIGAGSPSLRKTRLDVVAKLNATGGATVEYLINLAAAAGYSITIDEFSAFRAGSGVAGGSLLSEDWDHWFRVNSALNTLVYFFAGYNASGDPLASWGNERLECLINRHKPAHTQVIYSYT